MRPCDERRLAGDRVPLLVVSLAFSRACLANPCFRFFGATSRGDPAGAPTEHGRSLPKHMVASQE